MAKLSLELHLSIPQVNSFPLGKDLEVKKKLVPHFLQNLSSKAVLNPHFYCPIFTVVLQKNKPKPTA